LSSDRSTEKWRIAAVSSCPAPKIVPIIHGESAASPLPHRSATTPLARYHAPASPTVFDSSRHEAKIPRLNNTDHRPGSIQTDSRARSEFTTVRTPPATKEGKNCSSAKIVVRRARDVWALSA